MSTNGPGFITEFSNQYILHINYLHLMRNKSGNYTSKYKYIGYSCM